ncbi:zinc-dependent alcohol dehydrogenase family protein [Roseivirga sp.]|uniref:zinc-dependent alcohol dehydrogenase family protein n=1 Tax=Roseivirga sp. TaxID=1964215 RepID=UPI003B516D2A
MKAALYETFGGPITIEQLPDPEAIANSVVLKVEATGLCRSDWHGWMGHDADIRLPHVPGHELAGTVAAIGKGIKRFNVGDRVTVPFVGGCGNCEQCASGNHQVCDYQFQPGFTHWGSFAEHVCIHYADTNLVKLPDNISFDTAASLGCRFITSYRAVVHQGKVQSGQWVAVHGCGGVGLSAIMIAKAHGAQVIAIDINESALQLAKQLGADTCIEATKTSPVEAVKDITQGGAHLSLDALGNKQTAYNSIANLRKRGRHIQVGLLAGDDFEPHLPMQLVVANELEILGSHGMQAHAYPEMLAMIESGRLQPEQLIQKRVSLEDVCHILPNMGNSNQVGVSVVTLP